MLVVCWFFLKSIFLKNSFRNTNQSVKQFGPRSGLTYCQAWYASKLFVKVISRWHQWAKAEVLHIEGYVHVCCHGCRGLRRMDLKWENLTLCMLGNLHVFCCLLIFLEINFFKNFFQEHQQSVKQFGSR